MNQYEETILEKLDKEFKEWVCDNYTIEELFNSPKIKKCLKECFGSYFVDDVLSNIINDSHFPNRDELLRHLPHQLYDELKETTK